MSAKPPFSFSRISDVLILSAFKLSGIFGKVTAKGMPPVSVTCFKNMSIAIAIGTPNWDSTISADFLTSGLILRFSVAVFSIIVNSSPLLQRTWRYSASAKQEKAIQKALVWIASLCSQ